MATNKLLWSSKLIGVFFIMLVCTLSANAQFLRTSYFMEGTHYRQQLNPALTPTKGYFNLPVIGAVNATVGSTSLGYQDIIDIIDDGIGIEKEEIPKIFGRFYRSLSVADQPGVGIGLFLAREIIEATKAFITRLKFSEVTLLYSECGFSFDRKGYYNIGDSSFVDLLDSVTTDNPLLWVKNNTLSLASCTFERIRALGCIRGLAYAGKLNLVNYSPSGEFVMRAGLQSYIYVVESRSVFDFVPSVISECSDKTLSYSISVENEQLGNLSIRINLESELTHDVVFKYLFHRLI